MNERVFTIAEIKAAQEKVREKRLSRMFEKHLSGMIEENDGEKAFVILLMLSNADLFADEIIETLTGNEKTENN